MDTVAPAEHHTLRTLPAGEPRPAPRRGRAPVSPMTGSISAGPRARTRWGRTAVAGALALGAVGAVPARAQWAPNGTPVVRLAGAQSAVDVVRDGAGGAVVAWFGMGTGAKLSTWAKRVTSGGVTAAGWPAEGRSVADTDALWGSVSTVADGQGGAFFSWSAGDTTGTVRVQHLLSDGTSPGGPVSYDAGTASLASPSLCEDGAGAAFLAWVHDSAGVNRIALVRLSSTAGPAAGWPPAAVRVGGTRREYVVRVVADGQGGAYLLTLSLAAPHVDLFLYRVDAAGSSHEWPDTGIVVRRGAGQSPTYSMVASGDGVIVTWWDNSNGQADVFAQRYTGTGAVASGWPAGGVLVCGETHDQANPLAVPDGADGALVLWLDYRGANLRPYAVRILASGQRAAGWPAGGLPLCANTSEQFAPTVASDGAGGLIAAWSDARAGDLDIYAQRVLGDGTIAWATNGTPVCAIAGDQAEPHLTSDAAGNAFVIWSDLRDGSPTDPNNYDVYATRLSSRGEVEITPLPVVMTIQPPRPNPTADRAAITFELMRAQRVTVQVLDTRGRLVRTVAAGRTVPPGRTSLEWDGLGSDGRRVRQGIYFVRVRSEDGSASTRSTVVR